MNTRTFAPHVFTLTPDLIRRYARQLREQERAPQTIQKYVHDLTALAEFLGDLPLTKAALLEWKESLIAAHAPASVNSKIAAVNGLLSHLDRRELRLRPLKYKKPSSSARKRS